MPWPGIEPPAAYTGGGHSTKELSRRQSCFAQDKYDLSIVYTDVLKKTALQYGPNSPEVMRALIDLDDVFQVKIFLIV
jgi:hypothetical protein